MVRILTTAELRLADLEATLRRREMYIAALTGELRGNAAAVALHCDWVIADGDAMIGLDSAEAWSGAVVRMGRGAMTLLLREPGTELTAADAMKIGLIDMAAADPVAAAREWIGGRSEVALDLAASLIRRRGGDALERAAFAWLFSTGTPQAGLEAFLAKRRPRF